MPETGWMHEKFTASEKRDAAASWAKDLAKAGMSVVEGISGTGRRYATEAAVARDIAILNAIVADYDFQARQSELPL